MYEFFFKILGYTCSIVYLSCLHLFRGKFAVVRECTSKRDGSRWAAKIIKYSPETLKFALREFDMMMLDKMKLKGLVQLHEAYLVRKYLILIMDL